MIWTVQRLLQWTQDYFKKQGLQTPRVDAEILLSQVLGKNRIDLYVEFDRPVSSKELATLKSLIQRRAKHEPLQYITGHQEFWSLGFKVGPGVLIPRPETECLVEQALDLFKGKGNLQILDMGCGCGAISVVLAREFPKANIYAVDVSDEALKWAMDNAALHGVSSQIRFIKSDLFSGLSPDLKFDLIISNPPYLKDIQWEALDRQIRNYEPKIALSAGKDGIDIHLRIFKEAREFLKKESYLIVEIAPDQGGLLNECLTTYKVFSIVKIVQDYEHRDRVMIIQSYG